MDFTDDNDLMEVPDLLEFIDPFFGYPRRSPDRNDMIDKPKDVQEFGMEVQIGGIAEGAESACDFNFDDFLE